MKKIRIVLAAVFIMAMAVMLGISASAAETTAKISLPQSVEKGDSFTVTVTFTSSSNIGSAKARLDYDSDVIEFVSGEFASGAGGVCLINGWSETMGKTDTYELTFKAVGEGKTDISLSRVSVYSDIGDLIGSPASSAAVTVRAKGASQTTTTVTTTEPEQTSPTTTTTGEQTTPEETTVTETTPFQSISVTDAVSDASATDNTEQQPDADVSSDEAVSPIVTGEQEESSPESGGVSSASDEKEESDSNGAITAILLIVGCVAIACILMSSDGGGKGKRKKKSSRRR